MLYSNLSWIEQNQEEMEKRLQKIHGVKQNKNLYLYDVTSSYLEGECNELAEYGYNRDKKKGKATLVNLLGYSETTNFAKNLKKEIDQQIKKYGNKAGDLIDSVQFILDRKF